MLTMRRVELLLVGIAVAAVLVLPGTASARQTVVTSFDGTPIVANFFPADGLAAGATAPTVLMGPGWSSPGESDPNASGSDATGEPGVGALRRAGYNVLTWDPRGFGDSGDMARVDSKDYEGRDVQALLDYVAQQPEARLDAVGDPRVGMAGVSYGGGIQNITAAIDPRVDAIVPTIAWHSLITSLYKSGDVKSGWGLALCGLGEVNGLAGGLIGGPAGMQTGSVDPHVTSSCVSGTSTGTVSDEDKAWFDSRGPGDQLISQIHVPTMIVQGTVDTLFTLHEAIENHAILKRDGVPLKMMWFCGGHGSCLTGSGPAGYVQQRTIDWLNRYVKQDATVNTGPAFEWLADDAQWRSANDFPLKVIGSLNGGGGGTLPLTPVGQSGALILATPVAADALNIPIQAAPREADLLGEPRLQLTYSGNGVPQSGYVWAQLVDEQRNIVVDNQVTPVPITLDGARHSVDIPLEAIAVHANRGARYRLQLVPSTTVYYPQKIAGQLNVQQAKITLPIVSAH
jgi:ABC-2 type transport system ATP-binding protein